MTYDLNTATYITDTGNRMSEIEVKLSGYDVLSEDMAQPTGIMEQSVSHLNNYYATVVSWSVPVGRRPVFGELRTLLELEKIIDQKELT